MPFWTTFFSTKKEDAARPPALESLRLQVYRSDCVAMRVLDRGKRGAFAVRPLAYGLVEALVEEIGDRERVLTWDTLRVFGKSEEELFTLARTQAAAKMSDISTMDLDGGVQVLASNEFYLSAVLLHSFARSHHVHGVLFAPISWHHWCIHVVQPMTVPPTVALMALVVDDVKSQMRVGEFEALTGDLYWYKPDGVIEKLDIVGEGGDRRATSPELAKAIDAALTKGLRST